MSKFKKGDWVIIKKKEDTFRFGSSYSELYRPDLPVEVSEADSNDTCIVRVREKEKETEFISYRMYDSELELSIGPHPSVSNTKYGFRSIYEGRGMIRDLIIEVIVRIPNGDTCLRHAQKMIESNHFPGPVLKKGDIVTINKDLTDLYFGGILNVKGMSGRVSSVQNTSPSLLSKVRSHLLTVDFTGVGVYSIFESETQEYYNRKLESTRVTLSPGISTPAVPLTFSAGTKYQGTIIRAVVGASVIKSKTRYPQVISSNNKTIIKHGRINTGRQVQSAYF